MKQFYAPSSVGNKLMLRRFFLEAHKRAMAVRAIDCKPQTLLFEERVPSIDTSKMERLVEQYSVQPRITDNQIRFLQVFVGDKQVVVDLPNTVLAPSDAKRLLPRGFAIDFGCGFEPLQKYYSLSQIEQVTADLEFVWSQLWLMRSFPKVQIYAY